MRPVIHTLFLGSAMPHGQERRIEAQLLCAYKLNDRARWALNLAAAARTSECDPELLQRRETWVRTQQLVARLAARLQEVVS